MRMAQILTRHLRTLVALAAHRDCNRDWRVIVRLCAGPPPYTSLPDDEAGEPSSRWRERARVKDHEVRLVKQMLASAREELGRRDGEMSSLKMALDAATRRPAAGMHNAPAMAEAESAAYALVERLERELSERDRCVERLERSLDDARAECARKDEAMADMATQWDRSLQVRQMVSCHNSEPESRDEGLGSRSVRIAKGEFEELTALTDSYLTPFLELAATALGARRGGAPATRAALEARAGGAARGSAQGSRPDGQAQPLPRRACRGAGPVRTARGGASRGAGCTRRAAGGGAPALPRPGARHGARHGRRVQVRAPRGARHRGLAGTAWIASMISIHGTFEERPERNPPLVRFLFIHSSS